MEWSTPTTPITTGTYIYMTYIYCVLGEYGIVYSAKITVGHFQPILTLGRPKIYILISKLAIQFQWNSNSL